MKKRWIICLSVLAILGILLIANREVVRVVFWSNYDPQIKLDVENWTGGKRYTNVQYSDVSPSDYLNLYVPDGVENPPLYVMVHGGGFVLNDLESRQVQLMYQYFRDHGYACATINYRLAQEAKFPAALQDVKAAVRFLRANAGTYGYNADKIAIFGESAGGYLAVMAGATTDEEFNDLLFIGEDALSEPVTSRIDVIVDYYGCMVLEPQAERLAAYREIGIPNFVITLAQGWLSDAIKDYPGFKTVEDFFIGADLTTLTEEERQVFEPYYYVGKNFGTALNPKLLIWHGDADLSVPWTQSQALYDLAAPLLGEENVTLRYFHNHKHADENMFSDATLGDLKDYLDNHLR